MLVQNFPEQIRNCMQNKSASKLSRMKKSWCKIPPSPLVPNFLPAIRSLSYLNFATTNKRIQVNFHPPTLQLYVLSPSCYSRSQTIYHSIILYHSIMSPLR